MSYQGRVHFPEQEVLYHKVTILGIANCSEPAVESKTRQFGIESAGPEGIEPPLKVLETSVLPLYYEPRVKDSLLYLKIDQNREQFVKPDH